MPEPLDRNQTVWQRVAVRVQLADGECVDSGERGLTEGQKNAIIRTLHPYVIAERDNAKGARREGTL